MSSYYWWVLDKHCSSSYCCEITDTARMLLLVVFGTKLPAGELCSLNLQPKLYCVNFVCNNKSGLKFLQCKSGLIQNSILSCLISIRVQDAYWYWWPRPRSDADQKVGGLRLSAANQTKAFNPFFSNCSNHLFCFLSCHKV